MAILNAQGLPVQLLLQPDRNFQDLASGLAPGMALRGRVTEVLADGKAIISFRGINVTADLKNVTLARGEVITVTVQDLAGTPTFRLVPNVSAGVAGSGWSRPVALLPATQVEATLDRLGLPRDGFHAAVVRLLDAYGVPPTRESAVAVKDLAARLPVLFARAIAPVGTPSTDPGTPATASAAAMPWANRVAPSLTSASVPFTAQLAAWVATASTAGAATAPPPPTSWAPQYVPATPFLAASAPSDLASFPLLWQPISTVPGMPPAPTGSVPALAEPVPAPTGSMLPPPPAAIPPALAPIPPAGAGLPQPVVSSGASPIPAAVMPWEPALPVAPRLSTSIPSAPSLEVALGASRGYLLGRIAAAMAREPMAATATTTFGGFEPAADMSWRPQPGSGTGLPRSSVSVPSGISGVATVPPAPAPAYAGGGLPTVAPAPVRIASDPADVSSGRETQSGMVRLSVTVDTLVRSADALLVRMPDQPVVRELAAAVAELRSVLSQPRPAVASNGNPAGAPVPAPLAGAALAPIAVRISAVLHQLEAILPGAGLPAFTPVAGSAPAVRTAVTTTTPAIATVPSVPVTPTAPPGVPTIPVAPAAAALAPWIAPQPGFETAMATSPVAVPGPATGFGMEVPVGRPMPAPIRLAVAELAGLATGVMHDAVAREMPVAMPRAVPATGVPPVPAVPPRADASRVPAPAVSSPPVPVAPAANGRAPVVADPVIRLPLPAVDVIRVLETLADSSGARPVAATSGSLPESSAPLRSAAVTPGSSLTPPAPVIRADVVGLLAGGIPELAVATVAMEPTPTLPTTATPVASRRLSPMPPPADVAAPAVAPAMLPTGQALIAPPALFVVPSRPGSAPAVPRPAPAGQRATDGSSAGTAVDVPVPPEPVTVQRFLTGLAAEIRRQEVAAPIDPANRGASAPERPIVSAPAFPYDPDPLVPISAVRISPVPGAPATPGSLMAGPQPLAAVAAGPGAVVVVPAPDAAMPMPVVAMESPAQLPAVAGTSAAPLTSVGSGVAPQLVEPGVASSSSVPPQPVGAVALDATSPPVASFTPPPIVTPGAAAAPSVAPTYPALAALPAVSLPVLETAVFMHARGLPATPATAAAAHEFLFAAPRLPSALDRFEVAVAAARQTPQPDPLRAAVARLTGLVRAVRVSPDAPEFAQQLRTAVERMGLAHEAGLTRAVAESAATRAGVPLSGSPRTGPTPDRVGGRITPEPAVAGGPAARVTFPTASPAPSATTAAAPTSPATVDPRRTAEPAARFDAAGRPVVDRPAPVATGEPAAGRPAPRPDASPPREVPARPVIAEAVSRPAAASASAPHAVRPDRTDVPPPPAREALLAPLPAVSEREGGMDLGPLRDTIKAAALEVRREATEALRHAETPAQRQPLIALRDAAHEIIQSVSAQQLGSWTAADATSVVQVQIPLALGAEIRGGDIRVSWREEKQSKKRDPKVPAQMTMEIETRSLGPVGVHLEMLGNALSLIFRVYDEGVQAFVRDELPDLVNKLTGYDYRISRADCEVELPEPPVGAPKPTRAAPTTSLDLTA